MVPGRSGKAYHDWLEDRGEDFRAGVRVATLDPFYGYKNAIDDQLEVARLGRTLRQWREAFLSYFDTDRSSNGGTGAVNGLIELHRRVARGFRNRDNCRLRMLLIAGGLDNPYHTYR